MFEQTLDLDTVDGAMDTYCVHPGEGGPHPVVFLFMDGLGVRPILRAMARRIAAQGHYVLLPNLYHRGGRADTLELGTHPDRMAALFAAVTLQTLRTDIAALLAHLDRDDAARADSIGCVGYCMGGRVALTAAGQFPDRIAAAASIHGAMLAVDHADSPHHQAARMRGKIYIAVAEQDPWLQPDETARLQNSLDAAGADYTMELYTGAAHGFAVPGLQAYDEAAAQRHWQRVLDLFRDALA